jgi:hypothetical protein
MHDIQFDDRLADIFWRRFKLPRLADIRRPFYVETSHLVCKGWFKPMLRAGPVPSVILLRRDARAIALSMRRLGTIPQRTKMGRQFYLSPADRTLTDVDDWDQLDDYQCCYWHALETEARQEAYRSALAAYGRPVVDVALETLGQPGVFEALLGELGIPHDAADESRLAAIRGHVFNRKPTGDIEPEPDAASLSAREAEVRARIRPARRPAFEVTASAA